MQRFKKKNYIIALSKLNNTRVGKLSRFIYFENFLMYVLITKQVIELPNGKLKNISILKWFNIL